MVTGRPSASTPGGGALTAAAVAGVIGVRGGIAIGWAGVAISLLLLVLSPLPRIRHAADYPNEG
jgi:hypothetical protein